MWGVFMKVSEIFKDIYKGLRIESNSSEDVIEAYTISVSDVENCVINYHKNDVEKIRMKIKDKYYIKEGDIIVGNIPSNTTSHVGYYSSTNDDKVIITKNFIVLRNCIDSYNPEFVAEYLEMFGIKEIYANKDSKEALVVEDIEKINIPDISIEKQNELMKLIKPINQRNRLYNELIRNDIKIKEYMMEEVINSGE